MLEARGVKISEDQDPRSRDFFLEVTIDRGSYTPCIITSYSIGGESPSNHAKSHPFRMDKFINAQTFSSIATQIKCGKESFNSLTQILSTLIDIFFSKEAFSLTVRLSRNTQGELAIARSNFTFDDSAMRSSNRQEDISVMRELTIESPAEIEAEKDGIVYTK